MQILVGEEWSKHFSLRISSSWYWEKDCIEKHVFGDLERSGILLKVDLGQLHSLLDDDYASAEGICWTGAT